MESQPRQPPPRPKRARRRPAPSREATGKIVSVRTKQLDGTPAFGVFALAEVLRRLGLGADFAAGMEVSPGVVLLLRDDGVEFRVASGDLKEAYRVANDWAVAIRETASVPVRVQTLARDA
jgi:hypothetical protein